MKRSRKFNAMFLVVCMMMSAFVVICGSSVLAHETLSGGTAARIQAQYIDTWMEDDPNVADVDEPIVLNCDYWTGIVAYDSMYYLGDDNKDVRITFLNGADSLDDVTATLTSQGSPNPISADVQTDTWPGVGAWAPNTAYEAEFTIDIGNSGEVEFAYPMRVQISYTFGVTPESQTLDFEIWVSSVWEDDGIGDDDNARDIHGSLPNLEEELPDDVAFEAGETFQDGAMSLTDHAGAFNPTDVWGNITAEPTDIDITGGETDAFDPLAFDGKLYYRVDVPSKTASPGFKSGGEIQFQYTRSDNSKRITEDGRSFGAYVDFTPRVVASLQTAVQINQMQTQATLMVVFTNDGNVDLTELVIWPTPDGDWLDVSFHHYENDDDVYLTEMTFTTLGIGAPTSAQEVQISANLMLPNGTHRVPFSWSAWFYSDGSTGDASEWVYAGGYMVDHDNNENSQEIGRVFEDENENRVDDTEPVMIEGIEAGTYVDFTVYDDNGLTWEAIIWDTVEAGVGGEVRFTTLDVEINNLELVDYKDLVVEMAVGPTTPFLNPIVDQHGSTTPIMMDANSDTEIDADGTAHVYFTVDVNSAWWQANSLAPETYTVDLTVAATNDDDEVRIEDITIPAVVNIDGFGPELFAEMVNFLEVEDELDPGDIFTLEISIMNYGDDIAREVDVYLRADFVAGWSIVDQFVTAISPYWGIGMSGNGEIGDASWGWADDWENYDFFNRSRTKDIMPGDVGVDNVVEMVELYDWVKRRESPPQGIILWLHIDRLAPGANHTFVFDMVSDVNMVEGMTYYETLEIYYVDSNGETYGPDPDEIDYNHYTPPQEVLIRAGKGEKYQGLEEPLDPTLILYAVIFVIIVFILFLIGYALGRSGKGAEKPSEEPYSLPPEDEYTPPAEEDLGPPLDEKPPE